MSHEQRGPADEPIEALQSMADAILALHKCDCEVCARSAAICPASASSILLHAAAAEKRAEEAEAGKREVAKLWKDERDAALALVERLREELLNSEHPEDPGSSWQCQVCRHVDEHADDCPLANLSPPAALADYRGKVLEEALVHEERGGSRFCKGCGGICINENAAGERIDDIHNERCLLGALVRETGGE